MAQLWADVLRLDRVGIRDRFLDLGGDSLLASRVVTRVMAEFRIELPPQALLALLARATVAEMAAVVLERCLEQAGPAAVAELLAQPDAGPCA